MRLSLLRLARSLLAAGCATAAASAPPPPAGIGLPPAADAPPILADSAAPRAVLATATGQATWYSDRLARRLTASGIPYRPEDMIAAHRTYPFGTVLRVTNLKNDRSVVVRVVDRGPWGDAARQRATIVDLSRAAAEALDYIRDGRVPVLVEVLEWGDGR